MKKYFNKNGSTLLMILIMTAVLSVLGAVALSMSLMNLNMKYNNTRAKKTMYYAESGIDQVYAYVSSRVEKSINETRLVTDSYMSGLQEFLKDDSDGKVSVDESFEYDDIDSDGNIISRIFSGPILNDLGETVEFYISLEDRLIDAKAIEDTTNKFFKEQFGDKFDSENSSIKSYIETNISGIQQDGNNCNITVESVSNFYNTTDGDDIFTLNQVKSVFNYNDKAEKEISVDIVVKMPDNIYPFKKIQTIVAVENNPIWQNAFVSNSDIIFNAGTSVIKGDVYAFGKATSNYSDGGIKVGGTVNLTGDMVSLSYVQTTAANAKLNIDHGVIYCNSLVTKKGADKSEINVSQGNVYTEDDLELNADGSQVNILGSYYGMSDGSSSITHNESSCIIINGSLDKGTKLKITGEKPILKMDSNDINYDHSIFDEGDNNGVWIPGTSYINLTGEGDYWPYQTGESISIKGNYKAYIMDLPPLIPNPGVNDNEHRYDSDNVIKVTSYVDGNEGPDFAVGTTFQTTEDYNVNDKINYFNRAFYSNTSLFNFGTSTSIEISNYKYVLGQTIPITVGEEQILQLHQSDLDTYKELRPQIIKDFLYYLNNSTNGNVQYDSYDTTDNPIGNLSDLMDAGKYTFNIIDKHTNLNLLSDFTFIKEICEVDSYINDSSNKATEVLLISKDADDVIVNTHQLEPIDDKTNDIKSASIDAYGYMQGIIITNGNVIFNGDIDFTGVIIAGGDIIINGSNNTFHNSETSSIRYLIDYIRSHNNDNEDLRTIFNKNIDNLIQYYTQDIVNTDDSNDVNNYKDFVLMKNWKID